MDKGAFLNPPMDCRAAPFWAWNGDLNVEETRRQVREMTEHGMGGGFMHSRPGLRTEYLGDEWFANCAASIDEGKKVGFFSWLYDEDRWPSGSCGGRTAASTPDFRSRTLVVQRGDEPVKLGDGSYAQLDCLARVRMVSAPDGEHEFRPVGADERGPDILSFYSAVFPAAGWHNDSYYPDLMHDEAMREFIRNTYELYAQRFRAEFGKAVPGIFTDEPYIRGAAPWSVRLAAEFQKRRGYDLIPKLPLLFFATSQSPQVRHDYWKTVYELFNESFMGQLGKWCGEHNMLFTGHLLAEGSLGTQIRTAGGMMWHYLHMGAPGIDVLVERITEVLTCKQVSSVCNQFDKPLMLSELYGCTGYNFSFEGQKWMGDWQMALGVNLLCPHLTLYTMKGCAKRDYPPSYFYQSPWWRHYRHVADYQARLCYVLRQGRAVRDILLLHPLTGGWCRYDPNAPGARLEEPSRFFNEVMAHLLGLHRDFDLGDEIILAGHGAVRGAELAVGSAHYKVVIVPPTCNLESATVDLLEKCVQAGGKLLFLREIPALVDGKPSERVTRLAHAPGVYRGSAHPKALEEALDELLPRSVSVVRADTGAEAAKVLCQQRTMGDHSLLFLANTDRETGVALKARVPIAGAWEQWDCETGEVRPLPSVKVAGGSGVEVFLPPVGSAVLVVNPRREMTEAGAPPRVRERKKALNPRGQWSFRRLAPNSLVLDRCSYCVGDEAFSKEMFLVDAQEEWRKRFGLFSARGMNGDTQPWKRLQNPENLRPVGRLALRYRFQVQAMPANETFLVLEDRAETEIHVNGALVDAPASGWFMDKSFEKVPIGRFLKRGENALELRATLTAMRVMEDVYVVGDFGVHPNTFALTREPRKLASGDWCAQGYPFYTDAMIYETAFTRSEKFSGRVSLELERFEGTVAALWVNGERAAVLGWRPYRADVTRFLRAGRNKIGIEIVGSPRNLMGPRHSAEKYPAWTGSDQLADTTEPCYHITAAGLMGEVRVIIAK